MRTAASIAILIATSTAAAQGSPYFIEIVVDPPVIEPGDTATIELRAHFDSPSEYAMCCALTSLLCTTGSEFLFSRELIDPMNGPGTDRGSFTTAGIEGIYAGQLHFSSIFADPTAPMPFWRIQYRTEPDDAPGSIDLWTRSARYAVYPAMDQVTSESRMRELVEGSATLTVVACRADINQDRQLDLFDFLAFFNAFDAGEAIADFDFDGELTVFDFLAFQNRFDAGC